MATQQTIAQGMIDQLRALDPAISAEIGTPERMIIDTVAQALANAQIDLNVLSGVLDVDTKLGSDLDTFLGLFGFGRQQGARATGYVTLSREVASTSDIRIPAGTQVMAPGVGLDGGNVVFYTTVSTILSANSLSVVVPIAANFVGVSGNVNTGTINQPYNSPIVGITSIKNEYPTSGGVNIESDDEVKVRFKATGPFRNISGTESQYLATAIATLAKKATVVGPVTRHKEYVQVPAVDDAHRYNGYTGNGQESQYTSTLSSNNNAKYIYDNIPYFLVNEATYPLTYYNKDSDFVMNFTGSKKNRGDAYREYQQYVDVDPRSPEAKTRPNVTFTNVWRGSKASKPSYAIGPGDILLNEYSYLSKASRNDYNKGILNCVDVYVNNNDYILSNAVIPRPGINIPTIEFTTDPSSAFYIQNFRRVNEPEHTPINGNIFTPLFNQPAIDAPDTINLSDTTFYKGIHYWVVQDVTPIRGTVRARNGIEWSSTIRGAHSRDDAGGPYTGQYILQKIVNSTLTGISASVNLNRSTNLTKFVVNGINGTVGATIPAAGMIVTGPGIPEYTYITEYNSSTDTVTCSKSIPQSGSSVPVKMGYPITDIPNTLTNATKPFYTTHIILPDTGEWPDAGTIIVDNEHITYSSVLKEGPVGITPISGPSSETNLQDLNSIALTGLTRAADSTIRANHEIWADARLQYSTSDTSVTVDNYTFDNNIYTLQAALEGVKQITTDVLAHKAKIRYFKPDITIMYNSGSNPTYVNEAIKKNLLTFFENTYFGNTVQLSDILQVIHNTSGVDNVQWSKDLISAPQTNTLQLVSASSNGKVYTFKTLEPHNLLTGSNVIVSGVNPAVSAIKSGVVTATDKSYTINLGDVNVPSAWTVGSKLDVVGDIVDGVTGNTMTLPLNSTIISKTANTVTLGGRLPVGSAVTDAVIDSANYLRAFSNVGPYNKKFTIQSTPTPDTFTVIGDFINPGIPSLTTSKNFNLLSGSVWADAQSYVLNFVGANLPDEWTIGSKISSFDGANERQSINLGGSVTGGTFTLTFNSATTGNISYNASAATVQTALNALSYIANNGGVTVTKSGSIWTVEFSGSGLSKIDQDLITIDTTNIVGSPSPSVTEVQKGAASVLDQIPSDAYIVSRTANSITLSKKITSAIGSLSSPINLGDNNYLIGNQITAKAIGGAALPTSTDADGNPRNKLTETNIYGDPIVGAVMDKLTIGGDGITPTKYAFYFTGDPRSGSIKINFKSKIYPSISVDYLNNVTESIGKSAAENACQYIEDQINNAYKAYDSSTSNLVIVSPATWTDPNTVIPNASNPFNITFNNPKLNESFSVTDIFLVGGTGAHNTDFALQDDELATLPEGVTINKTLDLSSVMTIRTRSQSSWNVA